MKEFYQRLIFTRLSMNLNKKEFGALGGVSDVSQGRYEDENPDKRQNPGLDYLLNLNRNNVDIYYLLTGESSSKNLNTEESLLLEIFRNSDDESKKLMLDICRKFSGLPVSQNNNRQIEGVGQYTEKEIINHNPTFDQSKKK
ncbi:hypothetical protein MMG00_12785 [Ignatzschineria rhizosphaerae]|uniref:Transcriptional regulator n=1 Tax=Ignatzschineria rhizosphaerae TaxID=2923279 RepID=A0ABY3WZK3_9GAMM|nr:hypothetical protein [Ignatzschineria rhizosphaerae]UNM96057.1 hypothetical protein MMG00_12785 [Ignatzschineria rhizosphaerae]